MKHFIVAVVVLFSVAACSYGKLNQAVYQTRKVAVLSFSGANYIETLTLGPQSLIQGGNTWGQKVVLEITPVVLEDLQVGLDAEVILPSQIPESVLKKIPVARPAFDRFGVPGMPLVEDVRQDWGKLGEIAKELGVDAVVLFNQTYAILTDPQTHNQFGKTNMAVANISPTGEALFYNRLEAESRPLPASLDGVTADTLKLASPTLAHAMVRESALRVMHEFILSWRINRFFPEPAKS